MATTQFSFGTSNERPKTLYTSSIDAQAQKGGKAANGREVSSQMKTTSVKIGSHKGQNTVSEAKNQFVLQQNQNSKA